MKNLSEMTKSVNAINDFSRIIDKKESESKTKDAKIAELEKMVGELERVLDSPKLLEKLATLEHDRWSGWMKYQFEVWGDAKVAWWKDLMNTPYFSLSEYSKESDRKEARKSLEVIKKALTESKRAGGEVMHEKVCDYITGRWTGGLTCTCGAGGEGK